ncbi:iron complex transport system ATP-binding protein [Mesocricetibacter intestinalis]|uniref:Iron complex transport system ATP-binding protein n=1 Tax=Mesocricetibacter intestinalis TaxID=1521930 RepID=A0A4R6V9U4_9PAST|nr:ABC transporter ATP-binding protein [Mesocricetibacter intestinalis]TDQ56319.1 iron complex transport system ATP-binding protein [Mesocricetibacter intestinalis]
MLKIEKLGFRVQDKTLLRDISFSLAAGKVYGLIGHNGSGKSTLIKILSGENSPSQGEIFLDHKPLSAFGHKALARRIAYLPQHLPEAADFLVSELVMLGRFPWQGWLQKPSREDQLIVEEAMALTAVSRFAGQPVNTLSGGERQRVWLAMCLAQQSEYLLLDEPLAALDIVYQVEVLQLIRRLVEERGLTVVIIIHDINLAAQFCDELIALKQGRLCCRGRVEEVMNAGVLEDIFGMRLHLLPHPQGTHQVAVV